jgi:protein-S-isoprenylcysteine O-methyltransferase Ste14
MKQSTKTVLKWGAVAVIGLLLTRWHAPPAVRSLFEFPNGMKVSVGLWIVFTLYWTISARDSAPKQSAESTWSRQLHLILVNVALLLLILPVPGLTRRFLPATYPVIGVGVAMQAASLLFAVWARRHLGKNWSGEVRIAKEHRLVQSGPYGLVRHPIYTALLGMYLGTAMASGEIHAPLALVIVTLAYWRKVHLEEQALTQAFGADYATYRSHTWALVPLLF